MASNLDGVDPALIGSIREDLKDPSKWTGIDPALVNSIKNDIGGIEQPLNQDHPVIDAFNKGFNSQPIPKDSGFIEKQAEGAGSALYPAAGATIGELAFPELTPASGLFGAMGGRAVQNFMASLQGAGPIGVAENAVSLGNAELGQALFSTASSPYVEAGMEKLAPATNALSSLASKAGNFVKGGVAKVLGGTTGIPTEQMLKFIDNLPEAVSNSVKGYAKKYVQAITPDGGSGPLMGIKESIASKFLNAGQAVPELDGEAGQLAIRQHISPIIAKLGGIEAAPEAQAELEAIQQKKLKIDTDMENIVSKRENLSVQQARLNKQVSDSQEEISQIQDAINTARKSKEAGSKDIVESLQERLDSKQELFNATQNKLTQNSNALDTLKTGLEDQARQQKMAESEIASKMAQRPTAQEALDVVQGVNRLRGGAERDSRVLYDKWSEQAVRYLEDNGLPRIRDGLKAYELGKVGDLFKQLFPHTKGYQQALFRAGIPSALETMANSPGMAAMTALSQSPGVVGAGLVAAHGAKVATKAAIDNMAILAPKLLAQEAERNATR